MEQLLKLDTAKCTACYACVKGCPVKAVYINKNSITPQINEERCIGCGSCMTACGYGAITPLGQIEQVQQMILASDTAAICDPSIAGEFKDISDYRKFVNMIRALGFKYVCEVSFAVDVIAKRQSSIIATHQGKRFITSHCPVMTLYTTQFQPELAGNITPLVSPFAAMACIVRKKYGENLNVVSITPCLGAKKINARFKGLPHIDAFLSFRDLRKMFKTANIKEENMEFSDFDSPFGNKGSLYPIPMGFIESCGEDLSITEGRFITADGKHDALDAVNQFARDSKTLDSNLNVYFCDGCFMAPGCSKGDKFIRNAFTREYARKRAAGLDQKRWQQDVEMWSNQSEMMHIYTPDSKRLATPNNQQIEEVFELLGKEGSARSTNCKSCGYNTCLELAVAIAQGVATENMCYLHQKQDNTNYSNKLKLTTENLVSLQQEHEKTLKELSLTKTSDNESKQTLTSMLKHLYPAVAVVDKDLKIYLSNTAFIDILGEEAKEIDEIIPGLKGANIKTLLPDNITAQIEYVMKNGEEILNKDVPLNDEKFINVSIFNLVPKKMVGIIIRNLFRGEDRPEEIIHRLQEVVKLNLLDVQQIGFVVGEGAARTEKMLNSIIRSYKEQIGKKGGEVWK
ncbi:MAG: 4Fe-4S binding protein [Bacteroidales bacterium]|nr:4Fe-4S binding protein [Bacteroidales bacterium]